MAVKRQLAAEHRKKSFALPFDVIRATDLARRAPLAIIERSQARSRCNQIWALNAQCREKILQCFKQVINIYAFGESFSGRSFVFGFGRANDDEVLHRDCNERSFVSM